MPAHAFPFRAMLAVALLLGSMAWAVEEPSSPRWNVAAECQMIVLSQKAALPLLPKLSDDAQIESAWATLQQMIASGEATLIANPTVRGVAEQRMISESTEEVRYPTEFDPPQLPDTIPKEKAAEFLKNWPVVGITPTAFETRLVGAMLELGARVSEDGRWISADVVAQHVRFLRFAKYDAGTLPNGDRLSLEQPQFSTLKNTLSLHVRSGQRVLAGVHKPPGEDKNIELFILRLSTFKTGPDK